LLSFTGRPAKVKDEANPDWAPTIKMGHSDEARAEADSQRDQIRHARAERRQSRKMENEIAESLLALQDGLETDDDDDDQRTADAETQTPPLPVKETAVMSTQTDMCCADITVLEAQAAANNAELAEAREKAQMMMFTEESFADDDNKTRFYTGLPTFAILMLVFNFVKDKLPYRSSLTNFQQLLVVLMKLRLAVPHEDLAYRFQVSKSTISRTFNTGIDALYGISKLIAWPEREVLWKTMPMQFRRTFGKRVAVIIDCFEVFCQRPTSLEARAQTWSNYKHHNTVKFLIGCTPRGVISFLSAAWGGRGTDKTITLGSNFFDCLQAGDVILADRGFDIKDDAGFYGCEAEIPAFTRGKPQLSALDVEKTREIAHLRIHVERVIGGVRQKYLILNHTVPLEYMLTNKDNPVPKFDKVARICCALFNLNEPLVSGD